MMFLFFSDMSKEKRAMKVTNEKKSVIGYENKNMEFHYIQSLGWGDSFKGFS